MPANDRLSTGQVFARDYRVLAPLAEGGMGAVYVVEQLSTHKRRALKLIKPGQGGGAELEAAFVARFVQEATVAAHVESEHVVEVVAAGVEDGAPWIVMELLEGEDLAAHVERHGPLDAATAAEAFAQLCHGLGAAHRAGVVHRDLKPENVFVARALRAGAPFTVKLLDFGIAKVLEGPVTSARTRTVIGSPLWMAPEQLDAGAMRPATDVWALGLVAFWALTGRYYWLAANRDDATHTALMAEQLFAPLEPPSVRAAALGVAPSRLPPGFDAWFARAVVRDPTARFTDANAAGAALVAVLRASGPIAFEATVAQRAPDTAPVDRVARGPRVARGAAVIAVSAVVGALLVGLFVARAFLVTHRDQRDVAAVRPAPDVAAPTAPPSPAVAAPISATATVTAATTDAAAAHPRAHTAPPRAPASIRASAPVAAPPPVVEPPSRRERPPGPASPAPAARATRPGRYPSRSSALHASIGPQVYSMATACASLRNYHPLAPPSPEQSAGAAAARDRQLQGLRAALAGVRDAASTWADDAEVADHLRAEYARARAEVERLCPDALR